jgi:hypothetical protein
VYSFSIRDRELNRKSWSFRGSVCTPANGK